MFTNIPNGQSARNEHDSANSTPRQALAAARHTAWALSIGEMRPADAPRRMHRGMLPDVDMSMVRPDPNHRPLLGRIVALIGRLAGRSGAVRPAAGTMSGGAR